MQGNNDFLVTGIFMKNGAVYGRMNNSINPFAQTLFMK
jgi:hypothetical protein